MVDKCLPPIRVLSKEALRSNKIRCIYRTGSNYWILFVAAGKTKPGKPALGLKCYKKQ